MSYVADWILHDIAPMIILQWITRPKLNKRLLRTQIAAELAIHLTRPHCCCHV